MAEISNRAVATAAAGALLAVGLAFATSSDSAERPVPKPPEIVVPAEQGSTPSADTD